MSQPPPKRHKKLEF